MNIKKVLTTRCTMLGRDINKKGSKNKVHHNLLKKNSLAPENILIFRI